MSDGKSARVDTDPLDLAAIKNRGVWGYHAPLGQLPFVAITVAERDALCAELEAERGRTAELQDALRDLILAVSDEDPEAGWSESLMSVHSRSRAVLGREV
jgi:hypothetical protein